MQRPNPSFFLVLLSFYILIANSSFAQAPQWLITSGGTGDDGGVHTRVMPNGNVVVCGNFRNTIDLDPSSATYNITSHNATQDMYLACYSPTGAFIWGFALGREDYDGANALAVDGDNNIFLGGFFRGTNVDFDPSSGTALLTCKGSFGAGNTSYGGDGFVAKYSPAGAYQWVLQLGTPYWVEAVDAIAFDTAGNVVVGGIFKDTLDFDPSPTGSTVLDANNSGTAFLAKYTTNMQFLWAFNFGKSGIAATDNSIRDMVVDGNNDICITGFVQYATNIDFDPSPTGTANLVPNGSYDAYVAKYTASGAYVWAFLLGGNSTDDGWGISADNTNNIYVTGYTLSSSMDMDPSSSTATATAQGGGQNMMLASYNSNGQYRWGKLIGNSGNDFGRRTTIFGNSLYVTGAFSGTVNFNQGSSPAANMTSIGNTDIFVARYALQNGNIQCNFSVGSTTADEGIGIAIDDTGYVYITGSFSGSGTDFNPGTGTLTATSNGGTDAFLVKYDWGGSNAGYLVGDTICNGEQAYLTYVDTSGATNVTITYNDGTSNYTKSVTSGVPFMLNPNPSSTTTYTLVSGGGLCGSSSSPSQVVVQVNPTPVVSAGPDTGVCNTPSLQLNGSSSLPGIYVWSSSQSITNPNSLNPTISGTVTATYRLIVTTPAGCSDTDDVVVTALPQPIADAGPDMVICPADLIQLHGNGGLTYFWYSTIPILNPNFKDPLVHGSQSGIVYLVASNGTTCNDTDEVVITVLPKPTAYAGNDTSVCPNEQIELKGLVTGAGVTHKWVGASISNPDSLNIIVTIDSAKTLYLIAIDSLGCTDTSGIEVSLIPMPDFRVVPRNPSVCFGDSIMLQAFGGGTYSWQGGGLSATNDIIGVTPSASTTYTVIINGSNCGYTDTLDIPVIVNPLPLITVTKSNDIDCSNGSTILSATGASTYLWYPETGLNNNYSNQVTATPGENITYTVTGKTDSGCTADATVDVHVKTLDDYALIIPTAFTPDDNGRNDCYRVKSTIDFLSYKIQINNRWGQAVYSSENILDCWDGKYNGKLADLGTYYYFIKLDTKTCGTVLKTGDITLIR